jgi:NADH-quinone oxidoreductase subunit L
LVVIALGAAAWVWRAHLAGLARALKSIGQAAANSFGFEAVNQGVVTATQQSAEALRATQTGVLAWNVVGILLGLVAVLVILIWGA